MGLVEKKVEESVGQVWALIRCLLQFVPEPSCVMSNACVPQPACERCTHNCQHRYENRRYVSEILGDIRRTWLFLNYVEMRRCD